MDYSNKGILTMLQDLQRIHFGSVSIYVDVTLSEGDPIVACTVFDKDDEPHCFSFYSYESDDVHKKEYINAIEIINAAASA